MIQTESPYYQVAPAAPAPFGVSSGFKSDPTFDSCDPASKTCAVSWAVRFVNSESIYLYGAGLYSWFSEYLQTCLDTEDCQDRIMEIESSGDIWIYSLITKASVEMISPDGGIAVLGKDNKINFCSVVMAWLGSAGSGRSVLIHHSFLSRIARLTKLAVTLEMEFSTNRHNPQRSFHSQ